MYTYNVATVNTLISGLIWQTFYQWTALYIHFYSPSN